MCGIAGCFGDGWNRQELLRMQSAQVHRGPDDSGIWVDGVAGLAHNRLSILDLSAAGHQPMSSADGNLHIIFNGEIYNYRELRQELAGYPFRSQTDTEVLLAGWQRWGEGLLDRLRGMFAFAIWNVRDQRLVAVRDRFGVKPLYYRQRRNGTLLLASETRAIRFCEPQIDPDPVAWATWLATGRSDYSERTFWDGILAVPPGHSLSWQAGNLSIRCWYRLPDRTGTEFDVRPCSQVAEEYQALLEDSVRLRFRSDVPVAINLSGGLDSSLLLGLVQRVQGPESDVEAFTFATGDAAYDELPWVRQMLARTRHRSVVCTLDAAQVPELTEEIHTAQDAPFGGIPTLAYASLFRTARDRGKIVLLDGQGIDEQWAGYDYYATAPTGAVQAVQGMSSSPVQPECMASEFRRLVEPAPVDEPYPDTLRNRQYRDIRYAKIPRALRFNDRVSMHSSTELREPFLDHRLVEFAMKQRPELKIRGCTRKWLPRQLAASLLPESVAEAPKRPVQTPQREWLRGPLRDWATDLIEDALSSTAGAWLDARAVRNTMKQYFAGEYDNSFFVWQWISAGLLHRRHAGASAA